MNQINVTFTSVFDSPCDICGVTDYGTSISVINVGTMVLCKGCDSSLDNAAKNEAFDEYAKARLSARDYELFKTGALSPY